MEVLQPRLGGGFHEVVFITEATVRSSQGASASLAMARMVTD